MSIVVPINDGKVCNQISMRMVLGRLGKVSIVDKVDGIVLNLAKMPRR